MRMEIKVGIQIVLLIGSIFAFNYLFEENRGLIPVVSAEELGEETAMVQEILDEAGTQREFEDADQAVAASDQFSNEFADSMGSGVGNIFNTIVGQLFSVLPEPAQIAGSLFQDALTESTGGAAVCSLTTSGSICQPMLGNECDEECEGECYEGSFAQLDRSNECRLGTCFDGDEGTCEPRATQLKCEEDGGEWFDDPNGNIEQCIKGCCSLVDEALYVTERQCGKMAEIYGLEIGLSANFENVNSELECLASVELRDDGACVYQEEEGNGCQLTNVETCDSLSGTFWENTLCSNPNLDTECERQQTSSCIEGLDEIYWFDSCGNKENIYEGSSEGQREDSWNDGEVKSKEDSCVLGTAADPVRNQRTCGNCNRLRSSYCGEKSDDQKLSDSEMEVVCRDLGCYDDGGRIRENGESWCAYQGQIGLAGPDTGAIDILRGFIPSNPLIDLVAGDRAVDTPGSRHFRKSCIDGDVVISPCADYRNEICVESRSNIDGSDREFSQAACRLNRWQECLAYNPDQIEGKIIGMAGKGSGKLLKAKLEASCGLDPDCFVKDVNVDDAFQFSYCAPRYTPGFNMKENPEAAETLCKQASQMCTVIYVKTLSGWECKENCDCEESKFTHQMNEFCSSLGDCGFAVNYVGNPGLGGFSVYEKEGFASPIVSGLFGGLDGLLNLDPTFLTEFLYAEPIPGEYISSNSSVLDNTIGSWKDNIFADLNIDGLFSQILGGGGSGGTEVSVPKGGNNGLEVGLVSGGIGAAVLATSVGATLYSTGATLSTVGGLQSAVALSATSSGAMPALTAFSGAAMGAAAGFAITGFLIDILGIGPGLSPAVTYGLMAAGAIGGSIIGFQAITGGLASIANNPIGIIIAVVVIVIIIFLKIFGVGDVDKREIVFECRPWVPPLIGDCESCGEDGLSDGTNEFPCSEYSCISLAQNCKFVENSEGPEGGLCIPADIGDTSAPKIRELDEDVLSEEFEYSSFSESGFKIRRESGKECVSQFEPLTFGFKLDEYGRCSISGEIKEEFSQMVPFVKGLSKDQIYTFNSFELGSLGIDEHIEDETEVGLYVACEDYFGNNNVNDPYIVNICIDPEDFTPPFINYIQEDIILPFDATEYEIVVYVNEPTELRWDLEDVPFSEMENLFVCELDVEDRTSIGYECTAMIPIDVSVTDIFIRGKDHPELEGTDEEDDRNENVESIHVTIVRSGSALEINSISPDNEIILSGTPVVTVTLEVETSGGVDGTATCYYSIDNSAEVPFAITDSILHSQLFNQIAEGTHEIIVKCEDSAGNEAERTTEFSVELEESIPNVARVFELGGELHVITNERAECSFKNNGPCNFEVSEGEAMSTIDDGLEHVTSFNNEKTYYVKCKDEFDNEKVGSCDIIVTGGLF